MIYFNMFIDDERFPPNDGREWIICRNIREVIETCKEYGRLPDYVTFDHDLGEYEPTGHTIAKWMVDMDMDQIYTFPETFQYYVHSQNPVGKKNIESYLNSYLEQK